MARLDHSSFDEKIVNIFNIMFTFHPSQTLPLLTIIYVERTATGRRVREVSRVTEREGEACVEGQAARRG